MRWDLADEQEMFRDSFADWLADHASSEAVRGWLDAGDAGPFEQRMAADGWLGVGFSEEAGGQGGGLLELALAAEQLGHAAAPGASWLASVLAAPALASQPEVSAAVLEQGEAAALAVAAGRGPGRAGACPAAAGGPVAASHPRHLVVPVWADGQCTLFLAAAAEPAISRTARKLLDRSRSAADLTFTGGPAPPRDADGRAFLADAARRAAVLVAADSLGAADRMLRLAVDYSLQRTQFGVPIGSFQAVKHAAATMLVAVESSRTITYFAAASVEQGGGESGLHAAAAKAQVTAAAEQAADSALTMHGAIGYTWEHDLQLFYKRAKLNAYLFGTPQAWNERLASALPLLPGR